MRINRRFFKIIDRLFCYSFLLLFVSCATLTPEETELNNKIAIAEKAAATSDYRTAVKKYIEAIILAEIAEPKKVHSLTKTISRTYTDWARELYWKAKTNKSPELLNEAIYLCEKAREVNPNYKGKCEIYISKFKKELASMNYKSATSINKLIPNNEERNYQIAVLFKQAEVLRKADKYMEAVEKLEEILAMDPFNLDAARRIQRIMTTLVEIGKKRREADEAAKMAEVEWKNVEPVAEREEAMEIARREAEAGSELRAMLANSEIKVIDFQDIPLDKAFIELHKLLSKEITADFKFEFKEFSPADKTFAPVTFQAKIVPGDEAIEALCDGFNMYPTYSKNLVIIQKRSK